MSALYRIAHLQNRRPAIFPHLLEHLRTCRPKDVPQHASYREEFIAVLEKRMEDLSASQITRVKKVIKAAFSR